MADDAFTLPLLTKSNKLEHPPKQPFLVRYWDRWVWSNGPVLVLLCTIFFSAVAALVKLLHGSIPAEQMLFIRGLFVTIIVLPMIKWKEGPSTCLGKKENRHLLVFLGFTVFLHVTGAWMAIVTVPIADAVSIIFANTVFTAPLGLILRMEAWGKWTPVGVLGSMVGVILTSRPPMLFGGTAWDAQRLEGLGWAVFSSFMESIVLVILKKIGKSEGIAVLLFWQNSVTCILSFVSLCVGFPDEPVFTATWMDCLIMCGVLVGGLMAWLLFSRGSQLTSPTVVAVLTAVELGYALMYDLLVFHETFYPIMLLGFACIVGASAIVASTVTTTVN